jgi:hypothetical protein
MMVVARRIPLSPGGGRSMRSNPWAVRPRAVRMNATRVALAAFAFFVASGFAAATDSLTCKIDDAAIEFGLLASVGSSPDSLIGIVQGTLTLKPARDWPSAEIELRDENLAQRWIDPPEIRLWLSVSGDKKRPKIDLVIVGQRAANGDYGGRFRATARTGDKTQERAGRVTCRLECFSFATPLREIGWRAQRRRRDYKSCTPQQCNAPLPSCEPPRST